MPIDQIEVLLAMSLVRAIGGWVRNLTRELRDFTDYTDSPRRYKRLRRNMILMGVVGTTLPLIFLGYFNYHQFQRAMKAELVQPLRILVNRTKHSFELFLTERLSALSFIASAYSWEELADEKGLHRIFQVMKKELGGFVDIGLINGRGVQVNYVGPYDLKGKDYSDQAWFQEVKVRGRYVSEVFMGYRKFPHFVIAVERQTDHGEWWVLRATVDTEKFNNLIASMGLTQTTDAFVVNRQGVLQTPSKYYGKVMEQCPFVLPPPSQVPMVVETEDAFGREVLLGYTYSDFPGFILMVVQPRAEMLGAWFTLRNELFVLFAGSLGVIYLVLYRVTGLLVRRIQESDLRREAAHREMQYTSKLASIGRLAAGVAHEINNPMAIIAEKAGLMRDLLEKDPEFIHREKFLALTSSILQSVDRVKNITHRLLGFARRMDVQFELLSLNEVVQEVLTFLEKEAFHRSIHLELDLAPDLPQIYSDKGQLQQVFLNILNNAFEAVPDGGRVSVRTWKEGAEWVAVAVEDNGKGMSEEVMRHIFEPFFTTKKGYGTGLGLSITYGIVTRLGGKIQVKSKEGVGTTFTVILPLIAPQKEGSRDGAM